MGTFEKFNWRGIYLQNNNVSSQIIKWKIPLNSTAVKSFLLYIFLSFIIYTKSDFLRQMRWHCRPSQWSANADMSAERRQKHQPSLLIQFGRVKIWIFKRKRNEMCLFNWHLINNAQITKFLPFVDINLGQHNGMNWAFLAKDNRSLRSKALNILLKCSDKYCKW